MDSNKQLLSSHAFIVGSLDLLEQGESLERIMLRGRWMKDSTAMTYFRNWIYLTSYSVLKVRLSELSSMNS